MYLSFPLLLAKRCTAKCKTLLVVRYIAAAQTFLNKKKNAVKKLTTLCYRACNCARRNQGYIVLRQYNSIMLEIYNRAQTSHYTKKCNNDALFCISDYCRRVVITHIFEFHWIKMQKATLIRHSAEVCIIGYPQSVYIIIKGKSYVAHTHFWILTQRMVYIYNKNADLRGVLCPARAV